MGQFDTVHRVMSFGEIPKTARAQNNVESTSLALGFLWLFLSFAWMFSLALGPWRVGKVLAVTAEACPASEGHCSVHFPSHLGT